MMTFWQFTAYWLSLVVKVEYAIIAIFACSVVLCLYSWYKDFTGDKREKKAIKQALRDAGYVV